MRFFGLRGIDIQTSAPALDPYQNGPSQRDPERRGNVWKEQLLEPAGNSTFGAIEYTSSEGTAGIVEHSSAA